MTSTKISLLENAEILKTQGIEELTKTYLIGSTSHKFEVSNKAMKGKYLGAVLYLLQDNLSGMGTVCPYSTASCREMCLGTKSGRSAMVGKDSMCSKVQIARLRRTVLLKKYPDIFKEMLCYELNGLVLKAKRQGAVPCFRFNGTSDLSFEKMGIMQKFTNIQFYDYTKSVDRMMDFLDGKMPINYHLIFSYSPEHLTEACRVLNHGGNVAIVFDTKNPEDFVGKKILRKDIISGDEHDFRFLDPKGVIVGLTKKTLRKDMISSYGFFVNPVLCY